MRSRLDSLLFRTTVFYLFAIGGVIGYVKAFAQPADPTQNPSGFLTQLLNAFSTHQWPLAAALSTIALVAFVRFLAPRLHDKFGALVTSNRGSAVCALLFGEATYVAGKLMNGTKFSAAMLEAGFLVGLGAIGGYNAFWDLIFPPKAQNGASGGAATPPSAPLPPVAKAAVLLPILFMLSCGYCQNATNSTTPVCKVAQVSKQCGAPEVVKLVLSYLPEVVADLLSQNYSQLLSDLVSTLEKQGIADGATVVGCIVQVADSNTASAGATMPPWQATLHANAQAYLAAHPVK